MQPLLLNFAHSLEAIQKAANIDSLNQALAKILLLLEIKTYSYSNYSRHHPRAKQKLKYETCSKNFRKWHEYYLSEHYEEIDSTLRTSYLSIEPFIWILKDQLAEAKTPRERQMRIDGIAFGAIGGITVPIHGPHNAYANLTLVAMQGDCFLEEAKELMPLLFLVGHYYYARMFYLISEVARVRSHLLTKKEITCLTMQAHHFSVTDIAKKLTIKPRTVHFHFQNINRKLGVANKFEAVNKALEQKLI